MDTPSMPHHRWPGWICIARRSCCVFGEPARCGEHYELLYTEKTIHGLIYWSQLMRLRHRHDKIVLQPDDTRPHIEQPVITNFERLKLEVLPHAPYGLDLVLAHYYLFWSMQYCITDQCFNYKNLKNSVDLWQTDKPPSFSERLYCQ